MALEIYNSLTRRKEEFKPINPPFVGMYVCGPTVYNYMHLGNLRTFVTFDVVYRYLRFLGFKVRYVRNITDVGHITTEFDEGVDRIGSQARLEQLEPMEIAQKYTNNFHDILKQFNCIEPGIEPTATGHIIEQIELIQKILLNGLAYQVGGSVYFDVREYSKRYSYGELSGRNVEELFENTRDLDGQEEKRFFADFALWKSASPEHIMRWPSPWGEGFPGWHLECSAMSTKYLGKTFDIHGGGMDLKFPHHECEIAQNNAGVGCKPVNYWMHGNMLTVNGQKMSKSVGNCFLPGELVSGNHPLLQKGYHPMVVRFFMLQAHYAGTLDFTNDALLAAEKGFRRLMAAVESIEKLPVSNETTLNVNSLAERCAAAMDDDFNCPVLVATLFDAAGTINRIKDGAEKATSEDVSRLRDLLHGYLFDVLGLDSDKSADNGGLVDGLMQTILALRQEAKLRKDFATSDSIRDRLKAMNIQIKDGKDGATWELAG